MTQPTCEVCGIANNNWTYVSGLVIRCDCGHEQPMPHDTKPTAWEKALVMLVLCGVALLIFENAEGIVEAYHGIW